MQTFLKSQAKLIQLKSQRAIDNLIEMLEEPIDIDEITENKLKMACESKKEAYRTITYISNNSELTNDRKQEIVTALKKAFKTLMDVVGYKYQIKAKFITDEKGKILETIKGITADLQKSVAQAKKIAYEICIDISQTIDELTASEETKQYKIDNIKAPSIIETLIK